ncbi:MAG: hypothetical protein K2L02_05420, partial [Clostridia bacterium]|nr:hypothetical protein [Clostridia bacterium]
MRNAEIEILIEEYNERERAKRDNMLRARLSRPCSREELLARLGGLASPCTDAGTGQILLTKSSSPYIM